MAVTVLVFDATPERPVVETHVFTSAEDARAWLLALVQREIRDASAGAGALVLMREALLSQVSLDSRCYYVDGKNHVVVPGTFRSPEAWMKARNRPRLEATLPWRRRGRWGSAADGAFRPAGTPKPGSDTEKSLQHLDESPRHDPPLRGEHH